MPYKKPKIEKVFYTIGEVADMFQVKTSTIRFWENEFDELKPQKNKKGNRLFSPDDIAQIKLIYYLIKERGLTLKGAKQKLADNKEDTLKNHELVDRLKTIRQILIDIKDEMYE
ncbi:MerR family transcriptional regulator [Sunxiuqinia sp. A32]|uniref:MerR family transcriptional regulator n=1 Tax=Sunxiuqinia sp. A32 TaxID=3461496 RepID=UPI004046870D